jgi:hypothetical protein
MNLVAGSGVTLLGADAPTNNRVDIQITASGVAPVSSVFTRTGAVVAAIGDYTAAQVTNAVSQIGSYVNPAWIVSLPYSKLTGTPTLVNTFNTRSGVVVPTSGDYTAAQVTNAVDSTQTYANPTWLTSLAYSKLTGTPTQFWVAVTGGINYTGGLVGIGIVPNANYMLDVHGSMRVNATQTSIRSLSASYRIERVATTNAAVISTTGVTNDPVIAVGVNSDDIVVGFDNGTAFTERFRFASSGLIGVGGILPSALLDVAGCIRSTSLNNIPTSGVGIELFYHTGLGSGIIDCYNRGASAYVPLRIDASALYINQGSSGNVGIGTTSPTHQLELSTDSAAKPTTSTWTISSSGAVKKEVMNLSGGLHIINQLRPTVAKYNGLGGTPEDERVVSLIAEEAEKVMPYIVTRTKKKLKASDTEEVDLLGLNPHEIIFQLILAVQELSKELKELKLKHA